MRTSFKVLKRHLKTAQTQSNGWWIFPLIKNQHKSLSYEYNDWFPYFFHFYEIFHHAEKNRDSQVRLKIHESNNIVAVKKNDERAHDRQKIVFYTATNSIILLLFLSLTLMLQNHGALKNEMQVFKMAKKTYTAEKFNLQIATWVHFYGKFFFELSLTFIVWKMFFWKISRNIENRTFFARMTRHPE